MVFSLSPTELEAWRAFEEGDYPRVMLPPRWPFGLTWATKPHTDIRWSPNVEVWEKDNNYVIRAELPGVKKEDIEILTTGDTVTIGGTRAPSSDVKDDEYRRCEVCYGPFSRSIKMGSILDADNVEATFQDGILEIQVPKAKEAISRKIQITSS